MRALLVAMISVSVVACFAACVTTPTPMTTTPHAAEAGQLIGPPTITLTSLTADDNTLLSFVLHAGGTLGTGVRGAELAWEAKDDQGPLGSGTVPLQEAADQTFSVTIPVSFAKALPDLDVYQKADDIEVTLDVKVGDAATSRTLRMRSPHIPTFKVPYAEATQQRSGKIEVMYLLAIDNTNSYPLKIASIDYKCYLGGKLLAEAQMPVFSKLQPASHAEYSLTHHVTEADGAKEIRAMAKQPVLKWKVEGTVHFANLDVPFSADGDVKLDYE